MIILVCAYTHGWLGTRTTSQHNIFYSENLTFFLCSWRLRVELSKSRNEKINTTEHGFYTAMDRACGVNRPLSLRQTGQWPAWCQHTSWSARVGNLHLNKHRVQRISKVRFTHTQMHTHTLTHTVTHTHTHTGTHTQMHTHTNTHTHTHSHSHTHTLTQARTHMQTYIHTHTYTHTC